MSDGHVEDAAAEALRTAVMVASRMGDQLARLRENQRRHSEADTAQRTRELQSRLDAERIAARAQLKPVGRPGWWDSARPEQIGQAYQTAVEWRSIDPQTAAIATRIESELEHRYGLHVADTDASPDRVRAALQAVLTAREQSTEHQDAQKRLEAEAARLLLDADGIASSRDGAELSGRELEHDLAGERAVRDQAASIAVDAHAEQGEADRYASIADTQAREARILADKGQAHPAELATAASKSSAAKGGQRPAPARAQERSLQR